MNHSMNKEQTVEPMYKALASHFGLGTNEKLKMN